MDMNKIPVNAAADPYQGEEKLNDNPGVNERETLSIESNYQLYDESEIIRRSIFQFLQINKTDKLKIFRVQEDYSLRYGKFSYVEVKLYLS